MKMVITQECGRMKTSQRVFKSSDIQFDRLLNIDIDTFVTYDMDELFDESDKILINTSSKERGTYCQVVDMMNELMSELDKIRLKEFAKIFQKKIMFWLNT